MKHALRTLLLACALSPAALAVAQTAPSSTLPPASTAPSPATPAPAGTPSGTLPAHPAAAASSRYSDEASAKTACASDPVVWVSGGSKAFHKAGTRYYGKTKRGAYMCQTQATGAGFHAVRGEK